MECQKCADSLNGFTVSFHNGMGFLFKLGSFPPTDGNASTETSSIVSRIFN